MMEINSIITGKRGVCLPFTDYCVPVIPDKTYFKDIMDNIVVFGKNAGWKYIEFRGGENFPEDIQASLFFYGHTIDLSPGEDEIYSNFRDSTKRNIKKAIREGVEVRILNTLEATEEFYRLNCLTRKEHGLPPQPFHFFRNIYEHIISKKLGFVVLATYDNKTIAGAVYFHFGGNAIYKYGASAKEHQNLRANNLVMWEAIKWYCRNGFKSFCFGRTEPENEGLLQFKRGWGAEEHIINYYKYDFKKDKFVQDSSRLAGLHNKIFNKMPLPLLKLTGSILYRHIG